MDEFPEALGRRRELLMFIIVLYCFFASFGTATAVFSPVDQLWIHGWERRIIEGGQLVVDYVDHYGVSFSILFVVLMETIAVCWIYGIGNFSADVAAMLGFRPGIFWRLTWTIISPLFIIAIFVVACIHLVRLVQAQGSKLTEGYPDWAMGVGWILRLSSILAVPVYAIYYLFTQSGTTLQRLKRGVNPSRAEGKKDDYAVSVGPQFPLPSYPQPVHPIRPNPNGLA